jgi:hypothetical protein
MAITEETSIDPALIAPESQTITLDLRDLLPDSGGEIVIRGGGLGLTVNTSQAVTATGMSDAHVTASGEDVSGYRYYQLDGGLRLYSDADITLSLGSTLF